jgi:hypothetical protein
MTEVQWLSWADPLPMMEFLRGKASDRKLRLFACACCRRIWHLMVDERSRKQVEISEAFADGNATLAELRGAVHAAFDVLVEVNGGAEVAAAYAGNLVSGDGDMFANWTYHDYAVRAIESAAAAVSPYKHTPGVYPRVSEVATRSVTEHTAQAGLARCVFGNPFRPYSFDPRWLNSNVVDLARTIYDEPAFERLPILADALMDAGCADEAVFSHCRSDGPHVRGCWVVDLILGKN